ncbi:MAG: type II toxin-antitoxin system RelE/ParE family toxin [Agitococcus sp.]|jgi:proteic killer suppression protein|nr:type II toxin-antitoxin system RelE/ParE family toxin [Moraxellaceae bacterium]MBP9215619.1 type II toxin-antitoxin system RelE/ParE family toxin [Agitococcus sp.]MBK8327308.1 type II toxin-antitoxin system RelE/ParE family toxin [Moraxellaceae bacterium]MBK9185297.1 type II toxin-antitoxin system RelE/ParE family toxin [Moraxellaceae bacterium]MBL0229324.1 type II toxin-antitoxin system RelE/ParE family toxin [Moraxellaceae bacterium]
MIKGFRHKGLEVFFTTGSMAGIQAAHKSKLARQLNQLNQASQVQDMNIAGWKLHKLTGKNHKNQLVDGHYAVSVNGNWRLTFYFEAENAVLVDYQDYH